MALLLANENFPMPAVAHRRELGHDMPTLQQLNMAFQAIPDDEVLETAIELNRCLVTLNRKDFIKLHQQRSNHAGILISTSDADFMALAHRINQCLLAADQAVAGQLLRVQRPNL